MRIVQLLLYIIAIISNDKVTVLLYLYICMCIYIYIYMYCYDYYYNINIKNKVTVFDPLAPRLATLSRGRPGV